MTMLDKAEKIIDEAAKFYYDQLVKKLIYKLKRCPDEMRQNPVCSLNNFWEEVCVQIQEDRWEAWHLVDDYVFSLCVILCEDLPFPIKYIMSYKLTEEESREEPCYSIEEMAEELKRRLYEEAYSFKSKAIENYLF